MQKEDRYKIITEGLEKGISITCKKYNISRTIYYRWLKRYKEKGIDGLNNIQKDYTPINKTNKSIEDSVLQLIKKYPTYGPKALKYLLEELEISISESAVFNIMKRNNLSNKERRIRFSKYNQTKTTNKIPPVSKLNSGECWVFWINDYGNHRLIRLIDHGDEETELANIMGGFFEPTDMAIIHSTRR